MCYMVQAWSDKINNLFLLTVSSRDTITPTAGSFATMLSGGQNAAITAVVPYPSAPSAFFVQVDVLGSHTSMVKAQHLMVKATSAPSTYIIRVRFMALKPSSTYPGVLSRAHSMRATRAHMPIGRRKRSCEPKGLRCEIYRTCRAL